MGPIAVEWTEERIALVRALAAAGMSFDAIAAEIGPPCTRNSIAGVAMRKGISFARGRAVSLPLAPPSVAAPPLPSVVARLPAPIGREAPIPDPPLVIGADVFAVPAGLDPVALVDFLPTHCRWPLTCDDGQTRFCGRLKNDGSYCEEHGARAFVGRDRPTGASTFAPRRARTGSGFAFSNERRRFGA